MFKSRRTFRLLVDCRNCRVQLTEEDMLLDKGILEDLRRRYETMDAEGSLLSRAQLATCYETFRRRFGLEELRSLDGEALLRKLHGPGHDSLVYWLEFKNDEELPLRRLGSIAGGSALKFGIYFRGETQSWRTGNPTKQRDISVEEAIEYARRHRDQLVRGVELVQAVPAERHRRRLSGPAAGVGRRGPRRQRLGMGAQVLLPALP